MIGKRISKFYDADCMPSIDDEIQIQDFDTDELIELSDDEKPEDISYLHADCNHTANENYVNDIHNTMDSVIEMYKQITEGLSENS
jgi:hypothetical protein